MQTSRPARARPLPIAPMLAAFPHGCYLSRDPETRQAMANEPENRLIETDVRAASLEQIHAALTFLYRGDFVPALSLASAAEGILPQTNNPHFFKKLQEWQKLLPPNIGGA